MKSRIGRLIRGKPTHDESTFPGTQTARSVGQRGRTVGQSLFANRRHSYRGWARASSHSRLKMWYSGLERLLP